MMQRSSEIEKHNLRVLDTLFDLSQEEYCFSTVDVAMIIGQGNVHNWSSDDCAANNCRSEFSCVHSEDGTLWHVDDRSTKHAAEHTTVGDGESTTLHILESDLVLTSTLG